MLFNIKRHDLRSDLILNTDGQLCFTLFTVQTTIRIRIHDNTNSIMFSSTYRADVRINLCIVSVQILRYFIVYDSIKWKFV